MTGLWLGLLALVLAGPVPAVLARARWTWQVPRAALVLWQALAVAAFLAALGAGTWATTELLLNPHGLPAAVAVGVVTGLLGGRLAAAGLSVAVRTRRRRQRHRDLVDLLQCGSVTSGGSAVRVVEGQACYAYCLPGREAAVVLSEATLASLSPVELAAVVAHERAHLRARHDLLVEFFTALHQAFPRLVRSGAALQTVRLLVEMLADDAARRKAGERPLANALLALSATPVPAPTASGTVLTAGAAARVRRLAGGGRPGHRGLSALTYGGAAALLTVPTAALVLPWMWAVAEAYALR
ncbi:M56 family metallopeptidase [Motilibacter aurantiacus]|uniref:M56 family metallopeptidase n=1 Tax=Motilibacter aurantiacus TaxID=2714955 RepID=UPI00140DB025|nr:M56 family metallopeptidase [Motilibacter aurantiacus]NHC46677.1 M56 family metallopeptidase [Motilibacter aurantiacus]